MEMPTLLSPESNFQRVMKKNGAGDRTRTYDPIITNDVLYQLSYTGILLSAALLWPWQLLCAKINPLAPNVNCG